MPKKISYSMARVPDDDWENLMDTVTLDGSYSEEISNQVWSALENMEYFSNPWVIIKIKNDRVTAKIFSNQESAQKYAETVKNKLSANEKIFCVKGQYKSS